MGDLLEELTLTPQFELTNLSIVVAAIAFRINLCCNCSERGDTKILAMLNKYLHSCVHYLLSHGLSGVLNFTRSFRGNDSTFSSTPALKHGDRCTHQL